MTNEILDGNILIAGFMGGENSNIDGDSRFIRFKEPIGNTYAFKPKDFKYHSSWDWLMPVIQKIEKRYNLFIEYEIIESALCTLQIEYTWTRVVEFIKWHNQNKTLLLK